MIYLCSNYVLGSPGFTGVLRARSPGFSGVLRVLRVLRVLLDSAGSPGSPAGSVQESPAGSQVSPVSLKFSQPLDGVEWWWNGGGVVVVEW